MKWYRYFWALSEPEKSEQLIHFLSNLAIIGGLIGLVSQGPGRIALDQNEFKQ